MFLLVLAHPGSPGQTAVKRLLSFSMRAYSLHSALLGTLSTAQNTEQSAGDLHLILQTVMIAVGTCELFFCVRIESRIESAVRFDFESNFRIESAVCTTQAVTPSNELQGAPCRRTV